MRKMLLVLLLFCCRPGYAQEFGGSLPSIRWMQINTDSLRIIFPAGFQQQAAGIANTVMYLNRHERASIGNKEQKLNIVLRNHTVIPNGFVALSPFRAVFQTTPPSDNFSLGSLSWLDELSLHEYRHALQNMNFRSGIGKTFYDIFGDNGQAFITNLLIPDWFWEGDAVFMETALSRQGRGRLPSFLEPFKSLYDAGKDYSYAKIRNGSLKDLVPDRYPLGYMMTAYGRDTLGLYFWKNTLQQALLNEKAIKSMNAGHPQRPYHLFQYGFYPMSAALRYRTGAGISGFYRKALHHFTAQWEAERREETITPVKTIRRNTTGSVLNYRYPHWLSADSLLAVKYGYAYTPRIVSIDTAGQEHLIVKMGHTQDVNFSYGGHKLAWAEYRPDPRWGWSDYSVIRVYDMHTRRAATLTRKSRYFSPALSSDGRRIIAVNVSPDMQYQLRLLDAETGAILKTFPNPRHYAYTYPVFGLQDRSVITAVRDSAGRMALLKLSLEDNATKILTPFVLKPFGRPVVTGAYIYFPAAFKDDIRLYAFRRSDGRLFRVANRPLGNYSLATDTVHHRIFFDEYSADGYRLNTIPLDTGSWKHVSWARAGIIHDPYVPKALEMEGGHILDKVPDQAFPVSRYRGIQRLFKVHSWSLLPDFPEVGLYLQSQNILETLQVNAGGGYDLNEKTPFVSAYALFGGWFPFLQAGYKKTYDRSSYVTDTTQVSWNESNTYAGFYIPLNLSGSLYNRMLNLGGTIHFNTLRFHDNPALKVDRQNITYAEGDLTFSNMHIMPVQGIYPRFGQSISLRYRQTLDDIDAWQLTGGLSLFFPGLSRNHAFYLTASFAEKDRRNEYKFTDDFSYATGYHAVPYYQIYKAGLNYQLPLAYPDLGLTWAYLLRIRLNLAFDYSHARMLPSITPAEATFRSAGAAVFLDTKLFSALSVPIGIRYSYLLDKDLQDPGKKFALEITFPVMF